MTGPDDGASPPLLVIRGDASTEEVGALVAVLQAVAAATSAAAARPGPRVVPEWAAPRRLVHGASPVPGPGAWRASGLPGG